MEARFYVSDELLNVNDSMELDSGQCVAELEVGDVLATINVEGDVRVEFDGAVYRLPCEFPKELRDLFHNGITSYDKRVFVDDNNWFECFIYYKNPQWDAVKGTEEGTAKWLFDPAWCDVLDGGWGNAADVFSFLLDVIEQYNESEN